MNKEFVDLMVRKEGDNVTLDGNSITYISTDEDGNPVDPRAISQPLSDLVTKYGAQSMVSDAIEGDKDSLFRGLLRENETKNPVNEKTILQEGNELAALKGVIRIAAKYGINKVAFTRGDTVYPDVTYASYTEKASKAIQAGDVTYQGIQDAYFRTAQKLAKYLNVELTEVDGDELKTGRSSDTAFIAEFSVASEEVGSTIMESFGQPAQIFKDDYAIVYLDPSNDLTPPPHLFSKLNQLLFNSSVISEESIRLGVDGRNEASQVATMVLSKINSTGSVLLKAGGDNMIVLARNAIDAANAVGIIGMFDGEAYTDKNMGDWDKNKPIQEYTTEDFTHLSAIDNGHFIRGIGDNIKNAREDVKIINYFERLQLRRQNVEAQFYGVPNVNGVRPRLLKLAYNKHVKRFTDHAEEYSYNVEGYGKIPFFANSYDAAGRLRSEVANDPLREITVTEFDNSDYDFDPYQYMSESHADEVNEFEQEFYLNPEKIGFTSPSGVIEKNIKELLDNHYSSYGRYEQFIRQTTYPYLVENQARIEVKLLDKNQFTNEYLDSLFRPAYEEASILGNTPLIAGTTISDFMQVEPEISLPDGVGPLGDGESVDPKRFLLEEKELI